MLFSSHIHVMLHISQASSQANSNFQAKPSWAIQ